jgi:glycolate oxidase
VSARLDTDDDVRRAYETDASGLHLRPDAVARPGSAGDVVDVLRSANAASVPVTAAGAQTSTTGSSITDSGILLSLCALDSVEVDVDAAVVRVGPGARVADVKHAAARHGLLLAVDPTSEEECTIGGAIACNASGARTLKYGPIRGHVGALRVALANGRLIDVRRSELEKNTAGYALAQNPIDWFIGSEGTLGIVVHAELKLLPLPVAVVGIAVPFATELGALAFVVAARESTALRPRCIEYFDSPAFEIARAADDQSHWATDAQTLVYIEQELGEHDRDSLLDAWLALAELCDAHEDIRVFEGETELRHARELRHAIPSTLNERGARQRAAGGRKISTDWSVPYRRLADAITGARRIAGDHGAEPIIYGHAGNGHPHQNFTARNSSEVTFLESVVEETLRMVVSMGGTVAAEHGIGKIKRKWLPLQMSDFQISMMRAVKRELDPNGILAPGNIL